ncbi:leucine-rich repeat protein [Acetobacterium bakii]|uniref:leucine-rich repeat protein n=1 Tax=Acetobacterium bakii TaxID=52689 RepID=UPI000680A29D|nr:leucine-rich repeat protein [Acetobacterium bakii]
METKKTISKTKGKKMWSLVLALVLSIGLLPQMTIPVQAAEDVFAVLRSDGIVYETNADNTKTDGVAIDKTTFRNTVTVLFAAEDVTSIGDWRFNNCNALTTVNIPKVTSIGFGAFNFCTALASVEMPAVTSIDESAFAFDDALIHINIAAAETIAVGAFAHCEKLATAEMPAATSIGEGAFDTCVALISVKMPVVTSIGDMAFNRGRALTTVEMPAATAIGYAAFASCKALITVNLPRAMSIGESAFAGCTALTTVTMPSITAIGAEAFNECPAFANLTVGAAPPTVGINGFALCPCTTLTIAGGNTQAAVDKYNAVNDGDAREGYWYGWVLAVDMPLTYAVTVNGGTGSGDYEVGSSVAIEANTPETGQRLTMWTVESGDVILADPKAASTTFIMPAGVVEVTAAYEVIPPVQTGTEKVLTASTNNPKTGTNSSLGVPISAIMGLLGLGLYIKAKGKQCD